MAGVDPEVIENLAASPKSVTVDGENVTSRSVKELIEADEYLTAKEGLKRRRLPLRVGRMRPDGTT